MEPLASRLRPRNLDEFLGQEHILGPGRLLRRAVEADRFTSLIFHGPPGTGKTSLARLIALRTSAAFESHNAVLAGVKEIRAVVEMATERKKKQGQRTILFVDEIHRWNKSQQDALLPHVEAGMLTLIGATTQNPYFEVNPALISRSRVFELQPLRAEHLQTLIQTAIIDSERGYGGKNISIHPDAIAHWIENSGGDARHVLSALEIAVETTPQNANGCIEITREIAAESIQKKIIVYDKTGDEHYDILSAFIKSMRGSDPDAALYYGARLIEAGEDPNLLWRRILIFASEDIGLADPEALKQAVASAQAYDRVGLPEGRYFLSQAILYMSLAPKSNSTSAFFSAIDTVQKEGSHSAVPNHLRDASRDGKALGHGQGYMYPHDYAGHFAQQQYMPSELSKHVFYESGTEGKEPSISAEHQIRKTWFSLQDTLSDSNQTSRHTGKHTFEKPILMGSKMSHVMTNELRTSDLSLRKQVENQSDFQSWIAQVLLADLPQNPQPLVLECTWGHAPVAMRACAMYPDVGSWALMLDDAKYTELQKWITQISPQNRPVLRPACAVGGEEPKILDSKSRLVVFDVLAAYIPHEQLNKTEYLQILRICMEKQLSPYSWVRVLWQSWDGGTYWSKLAEQVLNSTSKNTSFQEWQQSAKVYCVQDQHYPVANALALFAKSISREFLIRNVLRSQKQKIATQQLIAAFERDLKDVDALIYWMHQNSPAALADLKNGLQSQPYWDLEWDVGYKLFEMAQIETLV